MFSISYVPCGIELWDCIQHKTEWHSLVCTGPCSCRDIQAVRISSCLTDFPGTAGRKEKFQCLKAQNQDFKCWLPQQEGEVFITRHPQGDAKQKAISYLPVRDLAALLCWTLSLHPASAKVEDLSVPTSRHISGSSWVGAKPWQAWVSSALSPPLTIWHEVHEPCDIYSRLSYSLWTERISLVSTSSKYEAGGEGRKVSRTETNVIPFHQAGRTPCNRIKIALCQK